MSFLTETELTLDEYKTLKKHYEDVIDPEDVSYYKECYDTEGDAMKEEEFLKKACEYLKRRCSDAITDRFFIEDFCTAMKG
jgi:hypothetical protein